MQMTEQDAEDLFRQINSILGEHGLTWLANEIVAEAAEGKASPKILSVQGPIKAVFSDDEIPARPARRKTEFTHVRALTSKEKMDLSIKALRAIVISSGRMLPEVLQTLNAPHGATISFVSETDAPPTVLSETEASQFSSAAIRLDEQLRALGEEVNRGS
jgi:hypothetical protein